MSNYCIIANIEDPVLGCLHQVAVESYNGPDGESLIGVRVNGTSLPESHAFYKAAVRFWLDYVDHLGGITDLDNYLFDLSLPIPKGVPNAS